MMKYLKFCFDPVPCSVDAKWRGRKRKMITSWFAPGMPLLRLLGTDRQDEERNGRKYLKNCH